MRRYKKNGTIYILVILLLGITLGYAYLNTTLNINGTTNITSANWSIYWDNIQFGSNNVTDITTPATISQGLTEVTFNVNFSQPGDTYEFTVDAVNDGSIDAMISVVSTGVYASNGTTPKALPDYLEYSVTYEDGLEISQNQILEAGDNETYKVRVHYKEDINANQLPSTNDNYVFKFSVTYVQATSSAIPISRTYTVNIFDGNYTTLYNHTNPTVVLIGQSIPNGITTYQTPKQAIAILKQEIGDSIERPIFLRHTVTNNIVTESYLGFVVSNEMATNNSGMHAGKYTIKGIQLKEKINGIWHCKSEYDDGNGNCITPYYNTNKATLIRAFGASNCIDYSNPPHIACSADGMDGSVYPDGNMYVRVGAWGYIINNDTGSSMCLNSW